MAAVAAAGKPVRHRGPKDDDVVDGPPALRNLLLSGQPTLAVPGVFSPSVALLAKRAGFRCAYFSGAAFSGLLGLPDLGVVTLSEVAEAVARMTSAVPSGLPLIVDVDTGFGEAVNVARTVSEMERAGAAAIQIEDQVVPKRCGHLSGKELVEPDVMMNKIVAAREARRRGLLIVARTDAAAVEGLDGALERASLYLDAGADIIFPEALTNEDEFREFARKMKQKQQSGPPGSRVPLLANMTEFGKTPYLTVADFSRMGYALVIFPVTAFRLAMGAVREGFAELAKMGTQKGQLGRMMTRDEFYDLIDYRSYESLDRALVRETERALSRRGK